MADEKPPRAKGLVRPDEFLDSPSPRWREAAGIDEFDMGAGDLKTQLEQMGRGDVRMTPEGFIDDAGNRFVGKHVSAFEHGERPLSPQKYIELPDGSAFYIDKMDSPQERARGRSVGRTKGGVASTPSSWKKPEFKKAEYPPYVSPEDRKRAEAAARALAREQELRPLQGPLKKEHSGINPLLEEVSPQGSERTMQWERSAGPRFTGLTAADVKEEAQLFQKILDGDVGAIRDSLRAQILERDDWEEILRKRKPGKDLYNSGWNFTPEEYKRVLSLPDDELQAWATKHFLASRQGELFHPDAGVYGTAGRKVWDLPEGHAEAVKKSIGAGDLPPLGSHGPGGEEAMRGFFLKSRNYERMIKEALDRGIKLDPLLINTAKKLGKVGLKAGLGAVGWGADLLTPSELGASTVDEPNPFMHPDEKRARAERDERGAEFLAEQPGYGDTPPWAGQEPRPRDPAAYETPLTLESAEEDFPEQDTEGALRRAAARRAIGE